MQTSGMPSVAVNLIPLGLICAVVVVIVWLLTRPKK